MSETVSSARQPEPDGPGSVQLPNGSRTGAIGQGKLLLALLLAVLGFFGMKPPLDGGAGQHHARSVMTPTLGDTVFYFGPEQRAGASGAGNIYLDRMWLEVVPGMIYHLVVRNGTSGGANRVTSAVTSWNGVTIIGAGDLTSGTYQVDRVVAPAVTDTLVMTVVGSTGSYVTVSVVALPSPEFTIFGDSLFALGGGAGDTAGVFYAAFTPPVAADAPYRLYVTNGDTSGYHRVTSGSIQLNGTTVFSTTELTSARYSMVKEVSVAAGVDSLRVELHGAPGSLVTVRVTARDSTPPVLTFISPPLDSFAVSDSVFGAHGYVEDETIARVTVNGIQTNYYDGEWDWWLDLPYEGWHQLRFVARNAGGDSTVAIRYVLRDTEGPVMIVSPADSTFTRADSVESIVQWTDLLPSEFYTNGFYLEGTGNTRSAWIPLQYGANVMTTLGTDFNANQNVVVHTVYRDTLQPTLTVNSPADSATTTVDSITVSGTASDASPVTVTVNGLSAPVTSGNFSRKVPLSIGSNTITTVAADRATNSDTVVRTVVRTGDSLPPPPDSVAPPLPQSVASTIGAATEFLYTGADPIQTGVSPGTILPQRAAVVRGKVLDSLGGALSGVTVSILDHAELGQTLSRTDGMFDLAVNGGTLLTVEYTKAGYLKAQRTVDVPWQDFIWADSVAMVTPGPVVGTVTFSSPMQVVRADSVSDSAGGRRPSLMFRDSTTVTATLPNDSTVVISGPIAVRVQEFTVGELGPARMPAALPATSAYTYAVALNLDTALTLGAKRVTFSKPVSFYLDNFLGIPVGADVPVGAYEPTMGQWVAQEDGRVVKVLSITNGIAAIAVDTSGAQANATQLAALGIDSLELTRIAATYPVNKTLWRVTTTHFSWLDLNFWFRLAADAIPPNGDRPTAGTRPPCHAEVTGCVIGVQTQSLGEEVPVVGTPYSLHYQSERLPGYGPAFGIDIPLRGDTIPPSVDEIYLKVEIAGQVKEQWFPRNVFRTRFIWDGKDGYKRFVQGRQPYTIGIGFVYGAGYGISCRGSCGGGGGGGSFGGRTAEFVDVDPVTRRVRVKFSIQWKGVIGPWNAIPMGLGGWTLSAHHGYDPSSRTLHLGTGGRREAVTVGNTLEQFAGNGLSGSAGDGGPALAARLSSPVDVAAGQDGSVYIADNHRIRKVSTAGVITTFAGNGTNGYSGDGGAATSAAVGNPSGVAVGPDGSVYIAQGGYHVIRRVLPGGTITTFAGTGTAGFSGDGGAATSAQLSFASDVEVGPDGSVYIADEGNRRIRKVGTNGIITTVVGNGLNGHTGNGGLALEARLNSPTSIAVAPTGELYIAAGGGAVRRVRVDGIINHFAGTDPNVGITGIYQDGKPAGQTTLSAPEHVAVGPDGTVYIAERTESINKLRGVRIVRVNPATGLLSTVAGNGTRACGGSVSGDCKEGDDGDAGLAIQGYLYGPHGMTLAPNGDLLFADENGEQIRRITTATPGLALGTMLVASPDGGLIYEFDARGQHQHTRDALTSKVILSFGYDSLGLIKTIADSNGNTTTITRDGSGLATGITAPFGQHTTLTTDGTSKLLTSVANPGGEIVRLWYKTNGLLDSLADPRNQKHRFTYDSIGQLTRDDAPDGSYKTLARTPFINSKTSADTGYQVHLTTAAGRHSYFTVDYLPSAKTLQSNTDPAGFKTTYLHEDGKTTLPDSTIITMREAGDPRWGMQAPTLGSLTVKLPSTLTATILGVRHDSLGTPGDPLSLVSQTDSVSLNNKWTVSSYTASTRRLVQTSPTGRQLFASLDVQGRVTSAQVNGLDSVRFVYDNRGRLSQEIDGGRTTRYGYNANSGRLDSILDPLSRLTRFSYDSAGRVKTQILPDGRIIAFAYDSNGNLTSLTPPSRPAHGFQYQAADLATQYDPPPLSGVAKPTRYFYNLDRQVDSIVRPDSVAIKFRYDAAGRPDTVHFDRGYLRFGYSATTGNLTSIRAPGNDSLKFSYDGSLPTQVTWAGSMAGSVRVKYNTDFRVDSQFVNGANGVKFTYDNDGLLTQAGGLKLGRSSTNGLLMADTLGPMRTAYSYSSRGELKGYQAKRSSTVLFGVGYIRDSLGRITQLFDTTQGTPTRWSYVYDGVGRLITDSINGTLSHGFTYDSNGNRLSYTSQAGLVTYRYDDQDRLLASYAGTDSITYSYTSNGELTRKIAGSDTTRYSYDVLGNLVKVILPSHDSIEYLIDGQNRRVGRKFNGTVTQRWLYQNQLNPVAELDSAGTVVSRFVYGSRLNVPDYMLKGGSVYRLVTDHLGSVRLVVDTATGTVAQWAKYDEWGVVTADSGAGFQPFGFAGGIWEISTGLVRFGVRDYYPHAGRWTAKDPIGFNGGLSNVYSYVGSDPVNASDPTGKILPIIPIVIGAWAVIEVGLSIYDAFNTVADLANPCLSGGQKALSVGLFLVGALAPGGGYSSLDDLSRAAARLDRNGLTKAGRSLQKHGSRPGSAFPQLHPNPQNLNPAAQDIVDDILTTPGSVQQSNWLGGIDVRAPDGRGMRFWPDGTFRGFLEP